MYKLKTAYVKNHFHVFRIDELVWELKNITHIKKTKIKENLRIPKKRSEWLVSPYEKYIMPIKGQVNINVWCNKSDEKKELVLTPDKFVFKNEEFIYKNTPLLVFNPNVYHQIVSYTGSNILTMYNCENNNINKDYKFEKIVKIRDKLTRWIIKNGGL